MPFESTTFAVFLTFALTAFWLAPTTTQRNLALISANYVFCGWLDFRFAIALLFVSAISFAAAFWIDAGRMERARRVRLVASLVALASTLLILKYGRSVAEALGPVAPPVGNLLARAGGSIVVPIGLSYYVLQTAGYCIDIYRGRTPERSVITYAAFVGFFPYLVAGPIVRAHILLPQFSERRRWSFASAGEGTQQIVWGLFKKLVVADSLAGTVDYVFARQGQLPASTLAVGLVMYSFQVYADFSGYSDIAIGLARLFGFDLPCNFDGPYFSRSVAEFWRRWHMSLSAWLRDYVYLPLGGRGESRFAQARNVLIVFTLSGLWHGMTWNFLVWGVLNGLLLLPAILLARERPRRSGSDVAAPNRRVGDVAGMLTTFSLISLSRVFFRAPDMPTAIAFFDRLFDRSLLTLPDLNVSALAWVALLLAVEGAHRLGVRSSRTRALVAMVRYPAYGTVAYLVYVALVRHDARQFLYARF
jgi:D-alanyl-lipoteichoic acid acyltransferase DltB (MBOAT superfamily)